MSVSTLAISRDLASKGFEKHQAEGLAEAIVTVVDVATKNFATKEFLKSEISDAKYTMVKWGIGLFALGMSFNATFNYFLINFMFKHLTAQLLEKLAQQG